jgi:hypothetical protein
MRSPLESLLDLSERTPSALKDGAPYVSTLHHLDVGRHG